MEELDTMTLGFVFDYLDEYTTRIAPKDDEDEIIEATQEHFDRF